MGFIKRIKNAYLCLKYPFLYPRNRFTGKYHEGLLNNILWNEHKKAFLAIGVTARHINPGEEVTKMNSVSESEALKILEKNNITYIINDNVITFKSPRDEHAFKVPFSINDYNVIDLQKTYSTSGSNILNVTFYLHRKVNDGKTYGFSYSSYNFPIKSLWKYKLLKWVDTKILDPLCGLLPWTTELEPFKREAPGWYKRFGKQFLNEIKAQAKKDKMLYRLRIMQWKEKYGTMRFYISSGTKEMYDLINSWESYSAGICIDCGEDAEVITSAYQYMLPLCKKCHTENHKHLEIESEKVNGKWIAKEDSL